MANNKVTRNNWQSRSFVHEVIRAIELKEIEMLFEPIVCLQDNCLMGFEVLSRWPVAAGRAISPSEFLPVAEAAGLLDMLLLQHIQSACAAVMELPEELTLSFNVSSQQAQNQRLPDQIASTVEKAGFSLSRIQIEVTEDAWFLYPDAACKVVMRLNQLGMKISLDDFGTGYSNYLRLSMLPFTSLKIDISFIRNLCCDQLSQEIVTSIITLCRRLNIYVIAEGVETEEQASLLKLMGCPFGQGHLFSKGVFAKQLRDLVKNFQMKRRESSAELKPANISH